MGVTKVWRRGLVLGIWLLGLLIFWWFARQQDKGPLLVLQTWLLWVSESSFGGLFLLGIYLLRPLLLLPMTILTVFAGFLFGLLWGAFYALAATLFSASLAYLLARYLGAGGSWQDRAPLVQRLRSKGFITVLTSRLAFVPGDFVNYASGMLRVPFGPFFAATALGGIPGLFIGVLAGASIEGAFAFEGVRFNYGYLLFSGILLVASLSISAFLRRRRQVV
ncbi:MAG: VTT domain-containing protein [Trueperaceae bacterium]|nr:MAG: VTT domain-containing protein [Trueperaceae bacterium]